MIKKRIVFIFSLLLLVTVIGAGCSNTQTTNTNSESTIETVTTFNVDLIVTIDDESTTYSNIADEGFSVLDVLQLTSDENSLTLETQESSFGVYVNGFAGKTGGDNNKYWLYYVNDESATVGVAEYIIEDGDIIEFKFE